VPRPEAYFEPINWHRTAVHELDHWTGHPSRLARDLSGRFGSALYAKEELVADMTSAFVCASLGIVPTVQHADYIGSWLEVLRKDERAIVRAASAASKAADYLLAFRPDTNGALEAAAAVERPDATAAPRSMRRLSTKWRHQLRHFTLISAKRSVQESRGAAALPAPKE
jgi:antirestriction protein ArdC